MSYNGIITLNAHLILRLTPMAANESKRSWGCAIVGFGVILLVFGGALGMYLMARHRAATDVAERLAELRHADVPTSLDELELYLRKQPIDPETDQRWRAILATISDRELPTKAKHLQVIGENPMPLPMVGAEWAELAETRQFVDDNADLIEKLHEVAESGGPLRMTADPHLVFGANHDLLHALRSAHRLLLLDAHVKAHDGDPVAALRSVDSMLAIAEALQDAPFVVMHLIRVAMDSRSAMTLEKILPVAGSVSDEQLRSLQERFAARQLGQSLEWAWITERSAAIDGFLHLRDQQANGDDFVIIRYGDLLHHLETTQQVIDNLSQPWSEAYQANLQFANAAKAEMADASTIRKAARAMSYSLTPQIGDFMEITGQGIALNEIAQTIIATRRFANDHGGPPTRINELVPRYLNRAPVDPFDGDSMRFMQPLDQSGRIAIYSIGADFEDDGGEMRAEEYKPDITLWFYSDDSVELDAIEHRGENTDYRSKDNSSNQRLD